jgi:hypothetical protein
MAIGLFCVHFGIFLPFWYVAPRQNLATLHVTEIPRLPFDVKMDFFRLIS